MFAEIKKINNPILRSVSAAFLASTLVTLVAGPIITIAKPKDESAYRLAVYASVASAAAGAIFGLLNQSKTNKENKTKSDEKSSQGWTDWRKFVVFKKVKESDVITSFYLKPEDNGDIPNFQPGQFLTIQLNIPNQPKPIIRTYSLSDYGKNLGYYRLSIKRESAPPNLDVQPGIASNYMHDYINEGSVILAKPPNGKFTLDVHQSFPVVLISNGVGITPMMSMAKACSVLHPQRHIWFIHGARDGKQHAFREEVQAIASTYPNLHIHYCYSRPTPEDEGNYHRVGYADIDLIKTIISPEIAAIYGSVEAEYYLCGSPSFMQSLREGLKEKGVPDSKVFFESFTKSIKPKMEKPQNEGTKAEIVFSQSGKTLGWTKNNGTILEFAEANNINPPYSCRAGICLTCMCKITEGEVEYVEPPTGTPDKGSVLICISQPKTAKVVLEI